MTITIIYVTPDHRYHKMPVDNATEKTLLSADKGKVLVHPNEPMQWLQIAVDHSDEWSEIDAPDIEEDAEAKDYKQALQKMGVDFND